MTAVVETDQVHDIRIADSSGDTRIQWDPDDEVSVATARAAFDAAVAKRHLIYRTDRHGNRAERIRTFDPEAEHIVCVPQTVGG